MLKVKIDGAVREYAYGTPYHAIAEEFQKDVDDDILLVSVNGRLRELDKVLTEDAEVRFLTARDKAGYMTYRRSALFLLMKAYYDVAGKEDISRLHVCFSLGSGIYIETRDGAQADEQLLGRVKARMLELRDKRISIHKQHFLPVTRQSCSQIQAGRCFGSSTLLIAYGYGFAFTHSSASSSNFSCRHFLLIFSISSSRR